MLPLKPKENPHVMFLSKLTKDTYAWFFSLISIICSEFVPYSHILLPSALYIIFLLTITFRTKPHNCATTHPHPFPNIVLWPCLFDSIHFPLFIFSFYFCLFSFFFVFLCFSWDCSKSHSFCPCSIRASTSHGQASEATNTQGATGNAHRQNVFKAYII